MRNQPALFNNIIRKRMFFIGRQRDGASTRRQKLAEPTLAIGKPFSECAQSEAECAARKFMERQSPSLKPVDPSRSGWPISAHESGRVTVCG